MLRRARWVGVVAALAIALGAHEAVSQDDEPAGGVYQPQKLTAGVGDQFLGQLSPDGSTLYFVSNRATQSEIFVEDVVQGRSERLFDEGSDATWPRLSPDGKQLLYLSFRDRATGQLCVRELPKGDGRRCLGEPAGALQAEWSGPSRIVLVGRGSIQGDLSVLDVTVGATLTARPLLERNLSSPAISPDGHWLAYVPIQRSASPVGPVFASQASGRLELVRLDRHVPTVPLTLDLPGITGQPAFSKDGHYLYVVQFLFDSNHDGAIDATDDGTLFRVPFPVERDDAPRLAAAAFPEQLTDSGWSCEYPAPAARTLLATCSHGANLDVYELPLAGEVPQDWSDAQLRAELDLSGRRAEHLLLYRRLLGRAPTLEAKRFLMVRMVRLHLDFGDFEAARFYAQHLAALPDPAIAELARPLLALIEHRAERRQLELGQLASDFEADATARLATLSPRAGEGAAALVVGHTVRSELADDLGDKGLARRELAAAEITASTPPSVIELYYERADALYRELDDAAALATVGRRLAEDLGLSPEARLAYARAMGRALTRGLPLAEAQAALTQARASAAEGSELAFAIDLRRLVLAIGEPSRAGAQAGLAALYAQQTRADRKRAIVLEAVGVAEAKGDDQVVEMLSAKLLADAPAGTSERRQAERLCRRAFEGRAYRRLAAGQRELALADFERVAEQTGSIESLIAALDLRLQAGETPQALEHEWQARAPRLVRLVHADLLARSLPSLTGSAHAEAAAAALAELRAEWSRWRDQRAVRSLYGSILVEQYLSTGDLAVAQRANAHLLIALDLVGANPRYRALVLGQLGLLQTLAGNYRLALGYLDAREKLPFMDDAASLAVRWARARALLHVGRESEAASAADEVLAMASATDRLSIYRPAALDRAALYNLAARRFDRSLALYDQELPLLEREGQAGSARNRLVAHLARAAAALGAGQPRRTLADLAAVDRGFAEAQLGDRLRWAHSTPTQAARTYRLLEAGLRANADQALGDLEAARASLEERRRLWAERHAESDRAEDDEALVLVETRLASNAADRAQPTEAVGWLARALRRSDELARLARTPVDEGQLDLLWLAAALDLFQGASLPFDLDQRLEKAAAAMAAQHDPLWRSYQRWLEIYQALAETPGGRTAR